MTRLLHTLTLLALAAPAVAQGPNQPDMTVDAATRRQVIDGVLARLKEAYVFPDTALAMERAVLERARRREYDRITSALAFAESLTAHLQAVSQDRHLRVRYSAEPIPERRGDGPSPEAEQRQREFGRQINFGFERVERLDGNVGYLELRTVGFEPEWIEETAAAAFNFLSNTDALIIDLRRNGGGSPHMVAFVTSYLFGEDTVHLNSLYWRPANRTDHFYTRKSVPGRRYGPDKPVYVLTSDRTFSGAEEFAYNLQTRKRATIVGDTTGGGAHPGGMQRVTEHFGVWVPSGRAINPITKTNWERVGVRPDIAVPADQALAAAHRAALRGLIARAADPERRQRLEEALAGMVARP
ncbi:MAG TPA: S41 family peptidase [Gemmatimonadales bacterium]